MPTRLVGSHTFLGPDVARSAYAAQLPLLEDALAIFHGAQPFSSLIIFVSHGEWPFGFVTTGLAGACKLGAYCMAQQSW